MGTYQVGSSKISRFPLTYRANVVVRSVYPGLTLVGKLPSPFFRKVCVVVAEKGIQCDVRVDGPSQVDTRIPEFNPLGKIPVLLIDGAAPLFDSRVIVEYLDGLTPSPRLIPTEFEDRVRVRRWEALADGLCDAAVAIVAENRRPIETERSLAFIEKQRSKIERTIAEMASALGDAKFCHGASMTLADLTMGVSLCYVDYRFPDISWRARYSRLARFVDTIAERPSFRRTLNHPERVVPDFMDDRR